MDTYHQHFQCSICKKQTINHVCSYDVAPNKKCGIPVCSLCKNNIGIEDSAPHRCLQHAPSSNSTDSSNNNSGSSTSASAVNPRVNDILGPKFKVDDLQNDRKRSPIWKYFAPFNLAFHPEMKFHRICLICRQIGIDKALAVGKKSSLGNLMTHLMSHPKENKEYAKITAEAEESVQEASKQAKDKNVQAKINFPVISNVKETFLNAFSKWTVEEFQPFNVGESRSFKGMIEAANPKISPPDTKTLKRKLHLMKGNATERIKKFLVGKYVSLTLDHWTSVANENYAALTLHTIDNFVLKSLTLSCLKHEGGSTADEMDDQLAVDLATWGLSEDKFVAMVTDTASNMTKLGRLVEEKYVVAVPHYCADHNLQLTTQKAYSGDIASRFDGVANTEGRGEEDVVIAVKKARDLVSHINSSPLANGKLASAQKNVSPEKRVLVLIQDVKTRWWSTYMMLERILSLKGAIKFMFSEEFRNRDHQDKKTLLEQLELSDNDFSVIKDVVHVLMPFKVAQEALEGQNYVNLSLLPIIIKKLRDSLHTNQGAIDATEQPQFYFMLSEMVDDFETRWGDETKYTGFTRRAHRGRITGIPKLAFWASMLDPRTKNSTLKILSIRDKSAIWDDIRNEIITIRQQEGIPDGNAPNNERATTAARPSLPAEKKKRSANSGRFYVWE